MKYDSIYERCQSAGQLETVFLFASVMGGITAMFVLMYYGFLLSLCVFLLSVVAYGLGRLFDLAAETLSMVGRVEESMKALQAPTTPNATPQSNPPGSSEG